MLRAGELREKIQVSEPLRIPIGGGSHDTTYPTVKLNTFASVIEERSNPLLVADQEQIVNYVHFKIRYRPSIFLNIGDRLTWRGFHYIINNAKVDPLRTQIDIYVNSEMKTSSREPIITT